MYTLIRNNKQDGATAVELAIVLPLLVLLIFAIIEFSLLLYNQAIITNAAREGARYGVVWAPTDENGVSYRVTGNEIKDHTLKWLGNNLISFDSSVARVIPENEPSVICTGSGLGLDLTVKVEYDYTFLFVPLPEGKKMITLESEATMKCESSQEAS